jgi:beta-galactosidase
MTIEAYIFPVTTTASMRILFRGDDRIGLDPYALSFANGNATFAVCNLANQFAVVSAPVPLTQWTYVAGTLDDATGIMRMYINGNLAATTTTTIRPFGALDPTQKPGLGIGNVQSATYNEYFNGTIDEVRISDQALSGNELLVPEPGPLSILLNAIGFMLSKRGERRRVRRSAVGVQQRAPHSGS